MSLLEEYFSIKWSRLFGIILVLYLFSLWLSQSLINEIVYYNTYSEQLTYDRAKELYETLKSNLWIVYLTFPVILLIKISAISLILYIGVIFVSLQNKISLGKMFRVVTAAEIVFVFAALIKILWFSYFAGNYTINDIDFFYPASLINLFNENEVDRLWVMPLQTVNLFHLFYILLLMYGVKVVGKVNSISSEKIVAGTYLPFLLFWIVFIMFLTIKP
jgi:hypothetical protein